MQRSEETIEMLQNGKVFVKLCNNFNVQDDISILNTFLTCGILQIAFSSLKESDQKRYEQKCDGRKPSFLHELSIYIARTEKENSR